MQRLSTVISESDSILIWLGHLPGLHVIDVH